MKIVRNTKFLGFYIDESSNNLAHIEHIEKKITKLN